MHGGINYTLFSMTHWTKCSKERSYFFSASGGKKQAGICRLATWYCTQSQQSPRRLHEEYEQVHFERFCSILHSMGFRGVCIYSSAGSILHRLI